MNITYQLLKLPEGFIVTSDEEIKRNHKYLSLKSMMIFDHDYDDNKSLTDSDFKVIAQQDQIDFTELKKQNCELLSTQQSWKVELEMMLQVRHGVEWYDLPNQKEGNDREGIYQKIPKFTNGKVKITKII